LGRLFSRSQDAPVPTGLAHHNIRDMREGVKR
jgi:hypothetical protein